MKYLLITLAFLCNFAFAEVVQFPGCPGTGDTVIGPLSPVWCEGNSITARDDSIRSFFWYYQDQPQVVFKAMTDYGINHKEMQDIFKYDFDFVHWMRANGSKDGFGGLKVWSGLEIDQYLIWANYRDIDDPALRVWAQDMLDRAARREAMYLDLGLPRDLTPWSK